MSIYIRHKFNILFFLFISICRAQSQTIEDASAFFMHNKPDSAFITAKNILIQDKNNPIANLIAGRSLVAEDKYGEAIYYLENTKRIESAPTYSKAWAMHDLALCYFSKGDYLNSKENLMDCIALNATKNVTSSAKKLMLKFGFDNLYENWSTIETPHFVFHFQDTLSIKNVSYFIEKKASCFDSVNSFFKAILPKKIDYFVWNDEQEAGRVFNHELAFSESSLCLTHTEPKHTVGHEMTHSISYNAVDLKFQNKLIAEGVCVYFDMSRRNNIEQLRRKRDYPILVREIWENPSKAKDDILYPLGSELVKRLIKFFGREKFMLLLKDQRFENAKIIYGKQLEEILDELDKDINH
jgi:hypothetical protein